MRWFIRKACAYATRSITNSFFNSRVALVINIDFNYGIYNIENLARGSNQNFSLANRQGVISVRLCVMESKKIEILTTRRVQQLGLLTLIFPLEFLWHARSIVIRHFEEPKNSYDLSDLWVFPFSEFAHSCNTK